MIDSETNKKIKPGAVVRVWEKILAEGGSSPDASSKASASRERASSGKESDKFRFSKFEGLVLARKHGNESGASFIVRATVAGVGVEKVYPIHSPMIEKAEIISSPKKVRRAKLYYVRGLSKKETRQKLG
ncbi:MAG: hypothetical protein A2745_01435 [Candidatus Harrisonbacteria bacterium RIFCSPHIGHO2_01_FULL_44_13]|uniref:50S ribosomal protein L19 n=1 Tax=Candidatus Harrisonbacteria bacterium RIFCSPLOWO2_01_FULL_44_18 TaxID=1798407 RepID=A0A1G1ZMT5_9BACT|nr:MAG: hypothetical protein A2745_01435 [Candidatus Harrisonbacteria bacterium RIFCSPHIGHO2_01_FULL_44_13]OGY65147.1 MAG: hypothetical protein A3A16_00395 [Candidatus Harrisonbacteria bacterium RIFCSPLOWO2_01_FULL_44_18]